MAASPAPASEMQKLDEAYDQPEVNYPLINPATLPAGSWDYMQKLYRQAHTAQFHRGESLRTLDAYMHGLADGLGISYEALSVYLLDNTSVL